MFYFAYGSNLDPERTVPLTSHDWGGGVASVGVAHGSSVWGMVYDLTEANLTALDGYEHFVGPGNQHNLYDRESTSVQLVRADDDSFPRRLRVWIYVARQANPSPPSRRYLDAVVRGARAHRLPEEYITKLAATPVVD